MERPIVLVDLQRVDNFFEWIKISKHTQMTPTDDYLRMSFDEPCKEELTHMHPTEQEADRGK